MKFYKVTDGVWVDGYHLDKDKAQAKADETNKFIKDHKDNPDYKNMSLAEWYVEEIETDDS